MIFLRGSTTCTLPLMWPRFSSISQSLFWKKGRKATPSFCVARMEHMLSPVRMTLLTGKRSPSRTFLTILVS